jgi:hypothetical protein
MPKLRLGFIQPRKPRNPTVAPMRMRPSGRHQPEPGAERRASSLRLIRDLAGFELPPEFYPDEGGDFPGDDPPSPEEPMARVRADEGDVS